MFEKEISQARAHIFLAINEPSCDDDSRVLLRKAAVALTRLRDLPDGMRSGVSHSLAEPLLDRCATLLDVVATALINNQIAYQHVVDAQRIVSSLFSYREI